jgi:signal transduction histidine kinase
VLLALAAQTPRIQATQWRVYSSADGLGDSGFHFVTIAEDGTIVAVGAIAPSCCQFNGYSIESSAAPGAETSRIYQTPGGQLWTASPHQLWAATQGTWTNYPVPEVSGDTPLCPLRQNTVLCLLPDRLVELSAAPASPPKVESLRAANQTRLGRFLGLTTGLDDDLWITGENGVAHIGGPKRALTANTLWQEFAPPAELAAAHFQHPEPDAGGVTMVADFAGGGKSAVHFDGRQWEKSPEAAAKILFAWRGPKGSDWAVASNFLLQFRNGQWTTNTELQARAYSDVAVDWRGTFWLATSSGLVRFTPALWEESGLPPDAPPSLPATAVKPFSPPDLGSNTTVACSLTTRTGDVWLGGNFGAAWRHDRWIVFPASDSGAPKDVCAFAELADGRIWCASRQKIWGFNGRDWSMVRGGFSQINSLAGGRDGSVWVGTARGVERFLHGSWIEQGGEEGMDANSVDTIMEDTRGGIWAKTGAAWKEYHPEADSDPPQTRVKAKNGAWNTLEGGSIMLTFAGVDKWRITPSRRLLYSHRLDLGEWSPFKDATNVTFSDLAPGRHFFQVRAMDRAGNVDPDPAHLEFAVVLPWYKEGRLVLVAMAGAGAAIFFAALAWKRHRQLRLSYTQVERQVAERTRELELASQELIQSQKMRALGTLAAGIAHDFNNILSIIKGSAQIIEANPDNPEKIRARVERIKRVVEQGAAVVRALLGFSQGSDDLAEPCEVNAVVENTLRLLGDRFLREVEIQFDRAPALPPVRASQSLTQQILLNFIFNAAESMNGRKKIVITGALTGPKPGGLALPPGKAGAYVAVAVRDYGCGIAPDDLPRLFEPFFTTKAFSTRRGTGLGLSIAYELARKMEAGLAVDSTLGEGSVFSLILPAAAPLEPKTPANP